MWVSWENVCKPTDVGGLGIKDISSFNDALLAKWKWRLGELEQGIWREVLELRYGTWRELDSTLANKTQLWWWRDLSKLCCKGSIENWFDCSIKWRLGDGKSVKF